MPNKPSARCWRAVLAVVFTQAGAGVLASAADCAPAAVQAGDERAPFRPRDEEVTSAESDPCMSGVDLSGLTADERKAAAKLLDVEQCRCGCEMSVAQCLAVDPGCPALPELTDLALAGVRAGLRGEDLHGYLADRYPVPRSATAPAEARLGRSVRVARGDVPRLGRGDAPVEIGFFTSFACRECARVPNLLLTLAQAHPGRVALFVKVLPEGPTDRLAARWLMAARDQDRVWGFLGLLHANRASLVPERIPRLALEAGVDVEAVERELALPRVEAALGRAAREAAAAGLGPPPILLVNGRRYEGAIRYDALSTLVARLAPPAAPAGRSSPPGFRPGPAPAPAPRSRP